MGADDKLDCFHCSQDGADSYLDSHSSQYRKAGGAYYVNPGTSSLLPAHSKSDFHFF